MAFFTSRADLNVGIVNQYVLNNNGIVQGQGQQVINFFNPTGGLPIAPSDGDRYISTATANGWVNNNIVVYDANLNTWKNMAPVSGTIAWLSAAAAPQLRIWNPTSGIWQDLASYIGGIIIQSFTTPGTIVTDVPPGVSNVRITMVGGGGGSATSINFGTGGGGSGCAIINLIKPVTPGVGLMTITVGAGGLSDSYGESSFVDYTGPLPFTIAAYGGSPSGSDFGNYSGGGSGGSASTRGSIGIPTGNGNGGWPNYTGLLSPAGGFGGDDFTTDGVQARPGSQGQTNGIVWAGSGGGGSGPVGASGGSHMYIGGISTGEAGGGAGGYFGLGGNGAPNIAGSIGSSPLPNTGAGAGGSYLAAGGVGGSGKVILEYF